MAKLLKASAIEAVAELRGGQKFAAPEPAEVQAFSMTDRKALRKKGCFHPGRWSRATQKTTSRRYSRSIEVQYGGAPEHL